MRATRRGLLCLAALLMFLAPPQAHAQKKNLAEAKRAFKAGQEHIKAKRWGEAIAEFTKAFKITKDGLVMGQIAMAFEKGGDYERAIEAMKIYRAALPASDRKPVDKIIARYQKMVKEGKSKRLLLPHEKPKAAPPKDTGKGGDTKTPTGDKSGDGSKTDDGKKDDSKDGASSRKGRFWTWIAAGSAGALALGALVVGLNAQSKFDELETVCKPACSQSDVDSVKTRALVADVLWGVAGAAAITAAILFFVEGGKSAKKDPLDDDDDVVKNIQVAPMVGQGRLGLGAVIRY